MFLVLSQSDFHFPDHGWDKLNLVRPGYTPRIMYENFIKNLWSQVNKTAAIEVYVLSIGALFLWFLLCNILPLFIKLIIALAH